MSEGWLFRLRTNLGAGRTAPTWPDAPAAPRDSEVPVLRRAAGPATGAEEASANVVAERGDSGETGTEP
jgi:hypothetical protein